MTGPAGAGSPEGLPAGTSGTAGRATSPRHRGQRGTESRPVRWRESTWALLPVRGRPCETSKSLTFLFLLKTGSSSSSSLVRCKLRCALFFVKWICGLSAELRAPPSPATQPRAELCSPGRPAAPAKAQRPNGSQSPWRLFPFLLRFAPLSANGGLPVKTGRGDQQS